MSISRNSITLINPDEGDGVTARQTKIDFMGFSDGEVDINDVFSGVGATSQSTGSGLDDITFQGTYTGTSAVTYYVKIDATGTPDTFAWSKDNFTTTEAAGVSLTGSAQTLDSGVTVTASATTGHDQNDVWQMTTVVDISDPHVLAQILVDHEGSSADDKGELAIKVNDGNDGQSPSKTVMTGHANGDVTFGGSASITGNLTVSGTTTTVSTTNLLIEDKVMTLNDGGAVGSGGSVGLEVEENGSATGFFKTNDTGDWTIRGANGAAAATATIDINTDAKTLTIAGSLDIEADSVINQDVSSDAAVTFASVDTGQGANELYAMNQDVETTDAVTFATVNTGQGANELYAMNQDVETTDAVTFAGVTSTGDVSFGGSATITGDLTVSGTTTTITTTNLLIEDKLMTLNDGGAASSGGSVGLEVEENGSATGFFKTNDTGDWTIRGANSAAAATATIDVNTDAKTLTIAGSLDIEADSAINQDVTSDAAVTFASVDTGQGANELYAMNQDVETTDAVTFATVNTGQGANELYAMNQDVETTDAVTFAGVTSTGAVNISAGVGVNVGSDAEGDIYFRNSSGNFARLAAGTSGHYLKTQGTSNPPLWAEVPAASPGGSDTQVQYNGSGSFAGDAGMTYNAGTDTLTVGALTESSDVTLKENISEYQSKEALQAVMAMQSHRYTWKENGVEEIGLIADEVENIIPELVTTRSMDNMKSLKYSKLVAVLSEAMKEQQNQIEELKAEIKALKN